MDCEVHRRAQGEKKMHKQRLQRSEVTEEAAKEMPERFDGGG